MSTKDENQRAINKACGMNPVDTHTAIDWQSLTDKNLYLLQYYGNTPAIRKRAKAELLKRTTKG